MAVSEFNFEKKNFEGQGDQVRTETIRFTSHLFHTKRHCYSEETAISNFTL